MRRWRIRYRQLRRILADEDARPGLIVLGLGGVVAVGTLVVFPREAPSTIVGLVLSATASFAGAYLSYAIVAKHLMSTERERINTPEAVCERYRGDVDLLEPSTVRTVADASVPERLPVSAVIEADGGDSVAGDDPGPAPDGIDLDVEVDDGVYEFPASVRGYFGPYLDDLRERFETEGKFNTRKARPCRIADGTVHIEETTYFRTFCTNFAPDLTPPNGGPTLREEFRREFLDDDGLVTLADSPFSNHLGGGGLLITADGFALLGLRTADVTVGERTVGASFSGNFEFRNLRAGAAPADELLREATEEVESFDASDARAVVQLALVRRVDWLGKPDLHAFVFADELETHARTPEEYYDGLSVDLGIDRIEAVEELFDPTTASDCVRRILAASDRSAFDPGVNLLSMLELWLRTADADRPSDV